ncbi:MAG: YkvA family protein [Chloroflexi bacterium]|nr:YkvA family protein [Chloroflexota bacterium]
MANKHDIINNQNSGFFQDLVLRLKLILRLMGDQRVNLLLKLLPIAAAIYVISPVDLIPGAVIPFIGALDDAVVIWLGTTLFVTLCPDDIVQEHTNALQNVVTSTWRDAPPQDETGEIIDIKESDETEEEQAKS